MRYTDWARIRFTQTSDPEAAQAMVSHGRKVLGELMRGIQLGGIRTGVIRRELPDGSTIVASFDGTTPIIDIDAPPTEPTGIEVAPFNMWIPRGFVIYPAWSDAPLGVGLPIVQAEDTERLDPVNLAPGLADRDRWTKGGPCGEVLVSRDKDAGYASNRNGIDVPLLYHPSRGPFFVWSGKGDFDAREPDGAWTGYRIELAPPVAHYSDESTGNALDLFDAINDYRTSHNAKALTLAPRGYFHEGQVMCSIMQAAGTTKAESDSYPPTYRTEADRLTKDGFSATLSGITFSSFGRGDVIKSREIRALGGTPASIIEDLDKDQQGRDKLTLITGQAGFCDAGFRGGYYAAALQARTRWIAAGNVNWQSADDALPPLSWHGFASVNLAWETLPAVFNGAQAQTQPLIIVQPFTDDHGDCWLNYPRSATPTAAEIEPAMSRYLYMRGRAIAMAPRGGLVWAASIVPQGKADRLLVLVHHPEDQTGNPLAEGFTRYLRLWWCDIPARKHLRADPQQTIVGEDADDPWAWRGGQLLDVGSMPAPVTGPVASSGAANSLKYTSTWRFAPDGLHAICLRDYAALRDYGTLNSAEDVVSFFGLRPRAVELVIISDENGASASVVFHEYTAGFTAANKPVTAVAGCNDKPGEDFRYGGLVDAGGLPIAVDYAGDGSVMYVIQGQFGDVNFYRGRQDVPDKGFVGYFVYQGYTYLGTGPAGAAYASQLSNYALAGCSIKTGSQNFAAANVVVLDVRSGAFAAEGTRPWFALDDDGVAESEVKMQSAPCLPFTTAGVHGVALYVGGYTVAVDWYPAPDGVVFSYRDVCRNKESELAGFTELVLAATRTVQGHYAERDGETVLGYQVSPIPGAVTMLNALPDDDICGCRMELIKAVTDAHYMGSAELNPRGGRAQASIPLPRSDWLIYSKIV